MDDNKNHRKEHKITNKSKHKFSDDIWIGIVFICLGIFFLLWNFDILEYFDNWWALFILIPALGSLGTAWSTYKRNGNVFTPKVRDEIFAGLLLSLVAAVFLFDLDWGKIWPGFLIIIGLEILLESVLKRK